MIRKNQANVRRMILPSRSLEYLHRNGIVHGDVKGRNLLLSSSWGEAKLADFGCSRRVESSVGREMWGGSPMWMAPEVKQRVFHV